MYAPIGGVGLPRLLKLSSAVPIFLLLSNCSHGDLVAPPQESPDFVAAAIRGTLQLELANKARLLDNGAVLVSVRIVCPVGYIRVESGPLAVSQTQTSATGEFHGLGTGAQICTGHWQWHRLAVSPFEGEFAPGPATASVQVDLEHPVTGQFLSRSDTEVLTIR